MSTLFPDLAKMIGRAADISGTCFNRRDRKNKCSGGQKPLTRIRRKRRRNKESDKYR